MENWRYDFGTPETFRDTNPVVSAYFHSTRIYPVVVLCPTGPTISYKYNPYYVAIVFDTLVYIYVYTYIIIVGLYSHSSSTPK